MDVQREAAIIIYTRNGARYLPEVLRSIRSAYPRIALKVVDSQSEDESAFIASEYGAEVHSISPLTFDFGATKNHSFRHINHRYVCILSQDCVPFSEHWLEELIAPLEEDEHCCATFGRQVCPIEDNVHGHLFYKHYYPERNYKVSLEDSSRPIAFSGAFAVYRTNLVKTFSLPEDAVMSEDLLWAREMTARGFNLRYAARACCFHYQEQRLGHFLRRNFDSGYSTQASRSLSVRTHSVDYVSYLVSSVRWLAAEKRGADLCTFLVRESLRLPFFYLGRVSRVLLGRSRFLRHLSAHRFYWGHGRG